jgi:cytosine/adenosine deaminase-related metal-dependent hydrolase
MTLAGGRIALSASESVRSNIWIRGSRIRRIHTQISRAPVLDLTGFLILPGFINAHDHLEFNLFPRLGRGPFANATEWARHIYRPREMPIREHLQVPKTVRLFWGAIKNLLSGVTTVSHHNPYQAGVFERRFPVRVVKRFGWAHSLQFSSDAPERFRQTPPDVPFIIHAGEGRDDAARREIVELENSGMLTPSTVIVHGVALERDNVRLLEQRGASVVWCPTSNLFTLGQTLGAEVFESGIPIALGTDSALTADGDFLDELCAAGRTVKLTCLYEMVTERPARILRLRSGEGSIRERGLADLTVVADNDQTPAEALLDLRPELVILNGRIKLFSSRMAKRLNFRGVPDFETIEVEGRGRYLIACRVAALAERARKELGRSFRLAGKQVVC